MRGQRDVRETSCTCGPRAGAPGASSSARARHRSLRKTLGGPRSGSARRDRPRPRGDRASAVREAATAARHTEEPVTTAAPRLASPRRRRARDPDRARREARWKRRDLRDARNHAQTRDARREASPRPPTAREEVPREVRARTMLASGNCVRRCAFQRGRECRGGTLFTASRKREGFSDLNGGTRFGRLSD